MEGLFAILAVLIPAIVLIVMARRVLVVARRLRDPEELSRQLKLELERALVRNGMDPQQVSSQDPETLADVSPAVRRDLQKAVLRTLFDAHGAPTSGSAPTQPDFGGRADHAPALRPRPIDHGSRSRASGMFVLLLLGFVLAVALLLR